MLLTVACVASALLLAVSGGRDDSKLPTGREESLDQCGDNLPSRPTLLDSDSSRFLVIVSTMDGRVTAMNAASGTELWSVNTGTTPLLSSSISKLEMMRGDKPVHLVPSLDGGLYQFDGDGIEPVPLGADLLLSTSFRFTDDSTIVGGKEIETYGIDINSGKVRYVCSTAGCKYYEGYSDNLNNALYDNDLLVIKRSTKTVRAVELQTGLEKWNFSVGQNDLSYISPVLPPTYDLVQDQTAPKESACSGEKISDVKEEENGSKTQQRDEIVIPWKPQETENEGCDDCDVQTEDAEEYLDGNGSGFGSSTAWSEMQKVDLPDIDVRVFVASGQVIGIGRNNPAVIHWQRKFTSAVAAAWVLNNQQLSELSLFDSQNIPAIEDVNIETSCSNNKEDGHNSDDVVGPLLYIGAFEGQIYVQPLTNGNREISVPVTTAVSQGMANMPRIRWRPYIATAPSRTPTASIPRNRLRIGTESDALSTAVIQWHEQYPFDEGFFLFPDYTPVEQPQMLPGNETVSMNQFNNKNLSLRTWWAVVVVSVLVSVCLNLLVFKYCMARSSRSVARSTESLSNTGETEVNKSEDKEGASSSKINLQDNTRPAEYISRYLTDFTQEACLGRGGFGVVFRVRNQLDDCVYAVKRIALHDSTRAREKVTREVKALAKLEHPGIVRYYQSWFENPPPGWQEERDKSMCDSSVATPTSGFSPVDGTYSCMKTEQKAIETTWPTEQSRQIYSMKRLESLKSPDLLSSYDVNHTVSNCGDTSEQGNSSSSDEVSNCSVPDRSLGSRKISPMEDSGTENDSFEISFRDDNASSSVPTVICSDEYEKLDAHDPAEDSFDIIFENSGTKPETNTNETVSQSHNYKVEKAPRNQRPQTLEIISNNRTPAASRVLDSRIPTVSKLYLYIQMQLCQPQNLKDWLNSNTLNRDKRQLLDIFHQMSSAINYVHNSGMMHRDLKPSNIFFAMDGSIKIGDFGLVTAVEENCGDDVSAESTPASGDRLHTDQVGTKLYMSPEQQRSARNYTHKVDIYALGMIFFELFYPFATEMERVKTLLDVRQMTFPPRFLRELADEANFVRPLLSHDPEARPSAKEILQHHIVKDFEEASQAYQRLHSQSRYRTMSNSSGNSTSTSEGSAVPNVPA